jgi:FMN phosphatase YigB (HAD superfamily)
MVLLNWMDKSWQRLYKTQPGLFSETIDAFHTKIDEIHRWYHHRDHYELSGQPWNKVSGHMSKLIAQQNIDFCYPEVHRMLKQLTANGWEMSILTYGDEEYQLYKISHCKLLTELSLPVHVVDESKRLFLAREFPKQPGILVDDKYPLNLPSHWKHIWINRGQQLKTPVKVPDGTWQISSLDQLPALLQAL